MQRHPSVLSAVRALAAAAVITVGGAACGSGALQSEEKAASGPGEALEAADPASSVAPGPVPGGPEPRSGDSTAEREAKSDSGNGAPGNGRGTAETTPSITKRPTDEEKYSFQLPLGDTSVVNVAVEDDFYLAIAGGQTVEDRIQNKPVRQPNCAEAQRILDRDWYKAGSPRAVLLYQAGIHLCHGKEEPAQRDQYKEQARRRFVQAAQHDGWLGVGEHPSANPDSGFDINAEAVGTMNCNMYQGVASVIGSAPKESFPCLPGSAKRAWPPNTSANSPDGKENPLS